MFSLKESLALVNMVSSVTAKVLDYMSMWKREPVTVLSKPAPERIRWLPQYLGRYRSD